MTFRVNKLLPLHKILSLSQLLQLLLHNNAFQLLLIYKVFSFKSTKKYLLTV